MPRNSDEALEWPDDDAPSLVEVIKRLDLELSKEDDIQPDLLDQQPIDYPLED